LEEVYGEISNRGYAYAYSNRRAHALRLIKEVLEPGAKILDLAAAQGNFSLALSEMGYDVTWNDLRAELADYVRLKYERGRLSFAPGNAFELHFDSLFDGILITEVIEHTAHPNDFLVRTAKMVRPGGYIFMTTPNGGYFLNKFPKFSECADPSIYESVQFKPNADGHIFLLHRDEIEGLAAKANLRLEKCLLFTNSLTNGHLKMELILRILPRSIIESIEALSGRLPQAWRDRIFIHMAARFRRLS
jgi:2-polyprenyl-3-methyl-5-hydroxy-6-metoxy-1,4-benzoquinol methylase